MALTNDQTIVVIRELVALDGAPFNFAKADVRAAIAAAEQWVIDNAASFDQALPQPFRGQAPVGMKAALLAHVALRRAGR